MRTAATVVATAVLALGALTSPAVAQDPDPAPTVAPASVAAPQITAGPTTPANDLAPSWEFTADEVASFECSLSKDGVLVVDWAACSSPTAYDLSAQPDGV